MSYTDVFGSKTVPVTDTGYAAYALTTNGTLVWPDYFDGTDLLAANFVSLSATAGLTLTLPPADIVSTGQTLILRNTGAETIELLDNAGGSLTTLATNEVKYLVVTANGTAAGSWGIFTFGTGTSAADANALASYGLKVLGGKLATDISYIEKSGNYAVMTSDRGRIFNVTTGSVSINLPQASVALAGFYVLVRNSSIGTITIDPYNTELVNGELTFDLSPAESAIFVCSGSGWYTVGYGRDVNFTFSEYVIDAAAGNKVLSASDVSGKMVRISGTAAGNIQVTLPAVDSIYFFNVEAGMGTFTATLTTGGAGTTLPLTANTRTAIYCDGTNVTLAITTSLVATISLDDGAASAPTLNFTLDPDTGLFRKGDNQLGVAAGGSEVGYFDSNGFNGQAFLTGTPTAPTAVAGTNTTQIATTAHVFAERSNALTLTNKTINLTSNTLTGTKAQFDTALSDDNFGYLATTNIWSAVQAVQVNNPTRGIVHRVINDATSDQTGAQIEVTQALVANWAFGQPAGVNAFSWWSGRHTGNDGTERMRLTSAGFLGVGVTAPDSYLHSLGDIHAGAAGAQLGTIIGTGYTAVPTGVKCNIGAANSTFGLIAGSLFMQPRTGVNATINFYTEGTEKVRIAASGRVGIGVTAPAAELEVRGRARLGLQPNATSGTVLLEDSYSGGESFTTLSTLQSSAGVLLGNGVMQAEGVSGIVSSTVVPVSKAAIQITAATFSFSNVAAAAVARGSPVTLTERFRIDASGGVCLVSTYASGTYKGPLIFGSAIGSGRVVRVAAATENIEIVNAANTAVTHVLSNNGNALINGFTQLGESSPAIKVKKLTGTTAATEGASVGIAHGLTLSKIVSITAMVARGDNVDVPPEHSFVGEMQYSLYADSTNIFVNNHPTNSGSILSKAVRILITYEE